MCGRIKSPVPLKRSRNISRSVLWIVPRPPISFLRNHLRPSVPVVLVMPCLRCVALIHASLSQPSCHFLALLTSPTTLIIYNLPLGEGNGTPLQYSCLENPMDRSLVGCSPWGREELDASERLHFHFPLSCIGEGNGNPLQCSCLENPRDGRAWWAAVCGVAQSDTTEAT